MTKAKNKITIVKSPYSGAVPVIINGVQTDVPQNVETEVSDAVLEVLVNAPHIVLNQVDSASRAQSAGVGAAPGGSASTPLPEPEPVEPEPEPDPDQVVDEPVPAEPDITDDEREALIEDHDLPKEEPAIAEQEPADDELAQKGENSDEGEATIEKAKELAANRDLLDGTVPEITAKLDGLDADQLRALRKAEKAGKTRSSLIAAIDDRLAPKGDK